MSQKREKEETQLKVSETLSLCTPPPPPPPPPDVPVSPPPSQQSGTSDVSKSSTPYLPSGTDGQRSSSISDVSLERLDLICSVGEKKVEILNRKLKRPREANRCAGDDCRRKLGLMGFRCRCGDVFCSEHRYSDRHDCNYDYKAAGREAIARENPVVKAAKILKV